MLNTNFSSGKLIVESPAQNYLIDETKLKFIYLQLNRENGYTFYKLGTTHWPFLSKIYHYAISMFRSVEYYHGIDAEKYINNDVDFKNYLLINRPFDKVTELLKEPTNYLYTLDAWGQSSNEEFQLPNNVFVLSPHRDGFDSKYMILAPHINGPDKFYPEVIAKGVQRQEEMFLASKKGWRLYKPGDKVPNLTLAPWDKSAIDPARTFSISNGKDKKGQTVMYKNQQAKTVEVFNNIKLKDVISELSQKNQDTPVLLAALCSNVPTDQFTRPSDFMELNGLESSLKSILKQKISNFLQKL